MQTDIALEDDGRSGGRQDDRAPSSSDGRHPNC